MRGLREGGHGQPLLLCQRMAAASDAHEVVVEELPAAATLTVVACLHGHDDEVELTCRQLRRGLAPDWQYAHLDTRRLAHEARHDAGHEDQLAVVARPDADTDAARR